MTGIPGIEHGRKLTYTEAIETFPHTSRAAVNRVLKAEQYKATVKQICDMELPEDLHGREMEILALSMYTQLPQPGGRTTLTMAEEFAIVKHALEMAKKGFSIDQATLKSYALVYAVTNHKEKKETKVWAEKGVTSKWVAGFYSRWGHLLSARYGEGMDGARRQVLKSQCTHLYDILEELGKEVGENMHHGERRLSARQLCNLDETNMRMTSKLSPVLAMKGSAKALRGEHSNHRDSQVRRMLPRSTLQLRFP